MAIALPLRYRNKWVRKLAQSNNLFEAQIVQSSSGNCSLTGVRSGICSSAPGAGIDRATLSRIAVMPSGAKNVRFGTFELDLRAGELRRDGIKIKLQDQPFQILAMLLEYPGRVVTREDLRSRLWPSDTFVDFDHSLNKAINKLREALADSPENPQFIETIPKRGYRFLESLETLRKTLPERRGSGD